MSFSERAGLASPRPLQRGSMDGYLRNGLWNAIDALLRRTETSFVAFKLAGSGRQSPAVALIERIWVDFRRAARTCSSTSIR